jgi:hypothetical protein
MKLLDAVNEFAGAQEGLISTEQLRSLDISKWTQQRLVADGWLRRIASRVYTIKGAPNTHRQRLRAGLLCLGEQSWVGFESAAALHGLDRSDHRAVEFTIERGRRPPLLPFAVHTSTRLRPVDLVTVAGFRATSATRTIFDLALAGAHTARVEAAIDSAVRLQLSSPEVLQRRLAGLRGSGRSGCRLVEELLTDSGAQWTIEHRFLEVAHRAGLPRPRTRPVFRHDGSHLARVDFLFEEFAAIVEVSASGGRSAGQSSAAERARDAQRRRELHDVGHRVFGYTCDDVTKRSSMVARTLRARLQPFGGPTGSPAAA